MLYMRTILENVRTGEGYPVAFGSFISINIGLHAIKRGSRSCAAVSWMWPSASDVCRYLAAPRHARCKCAGGTRAVARTRSRPGHVGMRAAGVCVGSCDQRRAGDSSAAAEELRAPRQRLKDMNIYPHEYAVYAYDTGKCAHGRGLSCRIWFFYIHKYWAQCY